jgi:hypothetical protein
MLKKICPFLESGHRDRQDREFTILTGDPYMGATPNNEWKGRDLAEATRAIDYRRGSGGATFVPMMQSTDLGKCDDLARRRLDRAGGRTIFV